MTFVGVESRVLIPETTFVGVESRVLIPKTTFVGVESRVLIPETTVWDTLVYPSDTLVILRAFAILPLGLQGSIRGYMLLETEPTKVVDVPASSSNPLSGEDRLKLMELTNLCTTLSGRVLFLEATKTFQAKEISMLKKRVKRLEKWKKSSSSKLKRLFKVGTTARVQSSEDEDTVLEMEEEARLQREKEEEASSAALVAEWDKIQARIEANYELAEQLQTQEQGELTVEEKSKLFVEVMDKRKKYFSKLRVEEKRRKPLTQAQRGKQMSTYLKNMAGYTLKQLKGNFFKEIKEAF
ncbi:hypothetical protein Tco_1426593, partial [Tanacetum coccineum]